MGLPGREKGEISPAQPSLAAAFGLKESRVGVRVHRGQDIAAPGQLKGLAAFQIQLQIHVLFVHLILGLLGAAGVGLHDVDKHPVPVQFGAAQGQAGGVVLFQPADHGIQAPVQPPVAGQIFQTIEDHGNPPFLIPSRRPW